MMGTLLTGLALASIVAAIIVKLASAGRNGKCAGCGCAGNCPASSVCSGK